ncbi:MAG: YraN family protein, partial [Herpetosiphon sp.]|nr:YraN family protein [Herpetosiphon sp.]
MMYSCYLKIYARIHENPLIDVSLFSSSSELIMTNQRKKLGAWGENLAAHQLESQGYTILARGWRCRAGEIDLIAQHDDMLVFG